MAVPADARNSVNGASAEPDSAEISNSSSSTVTNLETLRMLEAFSVELLEPGEANPRLVEQLAKLRDRTCLSRATYDVAGHCAACPVALGWLNDADGQRPVVAIYLAPTGEWIMRRRDLIKSARKAAVPLGEARYINFLDVDCEPLAVEHRLAWRLLRDSLKAIAERARPDARTITYSTSPGLRRFLSHLVTAGQKKPIAFWRVMRLTAEKAGYASLQALTADLGNMMSLADELVVATPDELGELVRSRGERLVRFLECLTEVYAAELFDPHTGHHLCPASRFHHYHGGKLVKVVAGGDTEDLAGLGVVMHFEYNYDRMMARRDRYRDLRRTRREPKATD